MITHPEPVETFAVSLRRWAAMPEGSVTIAGPRARTAASEDEDIALMKRQPRSRDGGPTSPKPVGKYAL